MAHPFPNIAGPSLSLGLTAPLDRLRRIADMVPGPDGGWLREGIAAYVQGEAPTLDHALDLAGGQGRRTAATRDRIARRNGWICRLARERYAGAKTHQAAASIAASARDYMARGWSRDRDTAEVPARHVSTDRAYLWHALRALEAHFPESTGGLARIIDGAWAEPPVFMLTPPS